MKSLTACLAACLLAGAAAAQDRAVTPGFVLPQRAAEPQAFTPCPFNPGEPFRLAVLTGVAGPDALRAEAQFVPAQIRACGG